MFPKVTTDLWVGAKGAVLLGWRGKHYQLLKELQGARFSWDGKVDAGSTRSKNVGGRGSLRVEGETLSTSSSSAVTPSFGGGFLWCIFSVPILYRFDSISAALSSEAGATESKVYTIYHFLQVHND